MEVRVYDASLNLKGIVDNQISFLWNRTYNDGGSFEGHFPVTKYNVELFTLGNLVCIKGAVDCGVIEYIQVHETADEHELIVSGRFLTSYLDRRILNTSVYFTGTVENGIRNLLSNMTPIPLLELGTRQGYTETVAIQVSYKNIWETVEMLAKSVNYGIRIRPDFINKKMIFELYKGIDHSTSQHVNHHVEFSERYGNLEEADFTDNDQLLKNVAVVSGAGEGEERIRVIVGDNSLTGLERREMHVDARDLQQEEGMTLEQYKEILRTRGLEKLAEQVEAKSFEANVIGNGNFIYKVHYDVGDIVTIQKDRWSITDDLRITALTEIYEHGGMNVNITFGTPLPTKLKVEED